MRKVPLGEESLKPGMVLLRIVVFRVTKRDGTTVSLENLMVNHTVLFQTEQLITGRGKRSSQYEDPKKTEFVVQFMEKQKGSRPVRRNRLIPLATVWLVFWVKFRVLVQVLFPSGVQQWGKRQR